METSSNAVSKQTNAWESLPDPSEVEKTLNAVKARGFKPESVPDRDAALARIRSLIPDGGRVMTGSSRTLDEIGLTALLTSGHHPWVNLKAQIMAEKDPEKQMELRRQSIFADYFLGSVHAITKAGEMVAGSASGSQLAAYAYGGKNLILVVGTQKITADMSEALRRLREYTVPLEDKRMKGLGAPGTYLSRVIILEREARRNVHVVLVNEKLGF
jgi:YkgG family uncharacterized protein